MLMGRPGSMQSDLWLWCKDIASVPWHRLFEKRSLRRFDEDAIAALFDGRVQSCSPRPECAHRPRVATKLSLGGSAATDSAGACIGHYRFRLSRFSRVPCVPGRGEDQDLRPGLVPDIRGHLRGSSQCLPAEAN